MRGLEEHRLKVAELNGREELLLKDIEEKERRVSELEGLLREVTSTYKKNYRICWSISRTRA